MAILECGDSLVRRTIAHWSRTGPVVVCVVPAGRSEVETFVVRIAAIECDATPWPNVCIYDRCAALFLAAGVLAHWTWDVVCRKVATLAAKRDL